MGKIPGLGCVCPALGLWRGAMDVSVVGMGSVNLQNNVTIKMRKTPAGAAKEVLVSLRAVTSSTQYGINTHPYFSWKGDQMIKVKWLDASRYTGQPFHKTGSTVKFNGCIHNN